MPGVALGRDGCCWSSCFLFLAVAALGTRALVEVADDHHHHDDDDGVLILTDSQRIVLGAALVFPVQGDDDIVLIVVRNNGDLQIVNITVTAELTSTASRRRSPVSLTVVCPPLYTDNIVTSLAAHAQTTCRAIYVLTTDDIVNGNVLYTASSAVGTSIDGVQAEVIAVPGDSQLSINNLEIAPGAVIGGATSTGPLNVITAPCFDEVPHTTLVCSAANELQLLFCDLLSNATQIGNIYMCVGDTWTFFGSVDFFGNGTAGPTGPTGPQGIGVYAATCAVGPLPLL